MQQVSTEKWLWNEIRYNNEQALYKLYHASYDRLFQYGISVSADTELVKASINEVFTGLWMKRRTLAEVENVNGYLFIYFKRVLLHQIRKSKKWYLFPRGNDTGKSTSEKPYEEMLMALEKEEEVKRRLQAALDQLTQRQKELIRLRYFEEMSFEEIADKTSISLRTIYNTIHSAISGLREAMKREDGY